MQRKAEVKIAHGQENMTKSGKVFTIFQLLQNVDGYTAIDGTAVTFQPYELFRVRRGARGAMSVELALGDERFLPLGVSSDGQYLGVVDPIVGQTILMNWTRSSLEAQKDGMGEPANNDQAKVIAIELGEGPVKTQWASDDLSADIVFDHPRDLERLGEYRKDENFSRQVFHTVAYNIEQLREPNAFELEFYVNIDEGETNPIVALIDDKFTTYRLDFEKKDMFAQARVAVTKEQLDPFPDHFVKVTMSNVKRAMPKAVEPKPFSFKEASANFVAKSKLEEQEIYDILGAEKLESAIRAILLSETSMLARKWMSGYVVRVVTQPEAYAGRLHVERIRAGEKPEGRGDIYHLTDDGALELDRHRMPDAACEGPVFSLEDITFTEHATFGGSIRERGYGRTREDRPGNRGQSRADMEPQMQREERPQSKIPTREWIPQLNQAVYIEDDPKKEMYFIVDYDQYEHKFLLILADSLRRERQARGQQPRGDLHNEKGQLPVEPGRLRPFVLFH